MQVYLAFSLFDGYCNPYISRIDELDRTLQVREDGRQTSAAESFRGLVQYATRLQFRIVLLVDQSRSVTAETEFIKSALSKFVDTLLDAGLKGCEDFQVLLAGFSGAEDLTMYTHGFVTSRDKLTSAIAEIGTREVQDIGSTNLYGAAMRALEQLQSEDDVDGMILVTFSDGNDEAGRRSEAEMDAEFDRFHSKADRFSFSIALQSASISDAVLRKLGRSGTIRLENVATLPRVFEGLAAEFNARASNLYIFQYCSPKRKGTHNLTVGIDLQPRTPPPLSPPQACVPGKTNPCTCTDGAKGAQTCDGSGYAPCQCTSYRCIRESEPSECSVSCGTGVTTTGATCISYTNNEQTAVVSDPDSTAMQMCGDCKALTRPCSRECCRYRPNAWSACSVTCGNGTRSRSLDCLCSDGLAAAPAECAKLGAYKPVEREACSERQCAATEVPVPSASPERPDPLVPTTSLAARPQPMCWAVCLGHSLLLMHTLGGALGTIAPMLKPRTSTRS